jgi:transcriptional regulator GlxA family with amidase domain
MTESDISLTLNDRERPTRIDVLLIDGFALMSHAAATEPFRAANILSGRTLYAWRHVALDGQSAFASNGLRLAVDGGCCTKPDPDLVIVVAGGDPTRFAEPRALAWLRAVARRGATIAGVSGGPWLQAQAGLLDGRAATIHWEHQPAFREAFPRVTLRPTLFVIDGPQVSCAGGTAGLDMGVELIARAHGRALARRVADWFIGTGERPAAASQRTGLAERYGVAHPPLLRALAHMEARIEEPAGRAAIAQVAGVSVRQLERLFAGQLGTTLGRAYLAMRLDQAAHLVRSTPLSLAEVAAATGFASTAHFSRAFRARHGQPPLALRRTHLAGG